MPKASRKAAIEGSYPLVKGLDLQWVSHNTIRQIRQKTATLAAGQSSGGRVTHIAVERGLTGTA